MDAVGPEEDPAGPIEPEDITDADAFAALAEPSIYPRTTIPNRCAVDTTAEPLNGPIDQPIPLNAPNAERSSTVVIDRFPLGNAGSPIPGMAQQSNEDTAARSVWGPFVSECDWQVAQWAKMRGATSSAVSDLLAIGEVRILSNLI